MSKIILHATETQWC